MCLHFCGDVCAFVLIGLHVYLSSLNSFIEDGKNPDLFTKSFIECVAGENQFTNGKITAMKVATFRGSKNLMRVVRIIMLTHHVFLASRASNLPSHRTWEPSSQRKWTSTKIF